MLRELLLSSTDFREDSPLLWKHSSQVIESLKKRVDAKRTGAEVLADFMTSRFGSMAFLIANVAWFVAWILINTNRIPGLQVFDPFPFSLLTACVSLEAIFLSIVVLMSQNRASKIDDLREEVDLQLDTVTEEEVTKALQILTKLAQKNGIDLSRDKLLHEMVQPTDRVRIEEALEKQVLPESDRF